MRMCCILDPENPNNNENPKNSENPAWSHSPQFQEIEFTTIMNTTSGFLEILYILRTLLDAPIQDEQASSLPMRGM